MTVADLRKALKGLPAYAPVFIVPLDTPETTLDIQEARAVRDGDPRWPERVLIEGAPYSRATRLPRRGCHGFTAGGDF